MIYSNLMGTTSDVFKVNGQGNGQLLSNNCYDLHYGIDNKLTGLRNRNVLAIIDGTDLDNVWEIGQYTCFSDDVAATYKNCPTPHSFVMDVSATAGDNPFFKMQKITDRLGNIWYRNYENGGIYRWRRYMTTFNKVDYEKGTYSLTSSRVGVYENSNKWFRFGEIVLCEIEVRLYKANNSNNNRAILDGIPYPAASEISTFQCNYNSISNSINQTYLSPNRFIGLVFTPTTTFSSLIADCFMYGNAPGWGNGDYYTKYYINNDTLPTLESGKYLYVKGGFMYMTNE